MRRFAVLMLIITFLASLILMPATATHAQAIPATWYYGFDATSGQLIAYDLTGQQTPLLTIDPDIQPQAWRLDADRMLAVLSSNGQVGVYVLTPTAAQIVNPIGNVSAVLPEVRTLAASSSPYYVLVAEQGAFATGLLVDLTLNQVRLLTGETFAPLDNWKFSTDATTLRYLSRESRDSNTWQLINLTLADGQESVLHNFDTSFPVVSVAANGDIWLYRILIENVLYYTTIFQDGSNQILAQEPFVDANTSFANYQIFGDSLLVFTAPCATDCIIEQRPLIGGSPQNYALPEITSPQVQSLARISDTQILVLIDQAIWLLDGAAGATALGQYTGATLELQPQNLVSPDGQWLVSSNGAGAVQVWFVPTASLAYEGAFGRLQDAIFTAEGVLLSQFEPRQTVYHRYDTGEQAILPHSSGDFYFATTPDGNVLYAQTIATDRAVGIYRYDPASGAYTLLVENLFPLGG